MFRKSKIEDEAPAERKTAYEVTVGAGTKIDGDMTVRGSARIFGEIIGDLQVSGELELELGARVKGVVRAEKARISGRIEGDVSVRDSLELCTGSHLRGDVYAKSFRIQDGAIFQGQCHMGRLAESGAALDDAAARR